MLLPPQQALKPTSQPLVDAIFFEGPPTTDPSQFLSANRATKPARVCVGFCDGVLAGFGCFARDGTVVGTRRARFVGAGGPRHGGLELWERV